jgi:hypothetical protein
VLRQVHLFRGWPPFGLLYRLPFFANRYHSASSFPFRWKGDIKAINNGPIHYCI